MLASTIWNTNNNVGLVVGATDVDAIARVRALAPSLWILAPGVGAQGGELEPACTAGLMEGGGGILFPVSRGISRADDPAAAAATLRQATSQCRAKWLAARASGSDGAAEQPLAPPSSELRPYQKEFLEFALAQEVRALPCIVLLSVWVCEPVSLSFFFGKIAR